MGLFEHFPYTNFHELNAHWLLEKVRELLQRMAAAEARLDAAEARLDAAEGRLDIIEADIADIRAEIVLIKQRLVSLESRCTDLEARMTAAEADIDALELRCTALESRCTALESRCTALENRVEVVYLELGYTNDSEVLAPLVRDMLQGKKQLVFYYQNGDPFGTSGNATRHYFTTRSVFQYNAEAAQTTFIITIEDVDASSIPAVPKVYSISADEDGITWPTIS